MGLILSRNGLPYWKRPVDLGTAAVGASPQDHRPDDDESFWGEEHPLEEVGPQSSRIGNFGPRPREGRPSKFPNRELRPPTSRGERGAARRCRCRYVGIAQGQTPPLPPIRHYATAASYNRGCCRS